jgi:hypothetical protein
MVELPTNRFCAICGVKASTFHLHEIYLAKHIQGIGEVIAPAVMNHKRVQIQVCQLCTKSLSNRIPQMVKEYHLEA